MKKTKRANTTLDADLAGYSATATATLAKTSRGRTLKRVVGFGAATSAALLAGTGLEAAIVYSGLQNIVLAPGASGTATTGIDMDGGGNDFILAQVNFSNDVYATGWGTGGTLYSPSYFTNAGYGVIRGQNSALVQRSGTFAANRLSSGQTVGTSQSRLGSSATFAGIQFISTNFNFSTFNTGSAGGTSQGNFPSSQQGFLGVQLGSGNFGWIQVHTSLQNLTIIDWAYDDSGAHLRAGDVPEPALLGLGLLSLGAAGVRELRRRKREAAEQVSDSTPTA